MKIIKYLILVLISIYTINISFAENINTSIINVDSSKENLIKIFLDKNIEADSNLIKGDIKLFKDLQIINITKDLESNNTVNIQLLNSLEKNTSYSLLSVYGVDGTIDFSISDLINGLEILGDSTSGIEKVNIINSKNIKVIFSKNIEGEDIDIKILKEYKLDGLKINNDNTKVLNLIVKNKLDSNSKYIIMLFEFSTSNGLNYSINNSIYDFTTSDILEQNAIISNEDKIKDEAETGKLALNSAETPDTGAETWIILLATFLLSNFIYFRKKFLK